MLLTPHTAFGVAIAATLREPQLAIPTAFFSHFVADFIPHWDRILGPGLLHKKFQPVSPKSSQFELVLLDGLLALTYGLYFAFRALPDYGLAVTILFCGLIANLPDMFYIPRVFWGKKWGFTVWVIHLQHKLQPFSMKDGMIFGLLTQAALIAICLGVTLKQIPLQ